MCNKEKTEISEFTLSGISQGRKTYLSLTNKFYGMLTILQSQHKNWQSQRQEEESLREYTENFCELRKSHRGRGWGRLRGSHTVQRLNGTKPHLKEHPSAATKSGWWVANQPHSPPEKKERNSSRLRMMDCQGRRVLANRGVMGWQKENTDVCRVKKPTPWEVLMKSNRLSQIIKEEMVNNMQDRFVRITPKGKTDCN